MINHHTFPRDLRLLKADDYRQVFDQPVRASGQGMLILARANSKLPHPRLGFVVPKKVLKLAVSRNHLKRIIRETFRLTRHTLGNIDIVFIARASIATMKDDEIRAQTQRLWKNVSAQLSVQQ